MSNNSTAETSKPLETYPLVQVSLWLWKICPPVILLLGTFGNVMTIVVLRRMSARQSAVSMSVYFIALAVSDLIQTYFGLLTGWLAVSFGTVVNDVSVSTCKCGVYLIYVFGMTSSWFLVAMTSQRVTSIMWPHRANHLCSPKQSYVVLTIIIVLCAMVNSHKLYSYTLVYQNNTKYCVPANAMVRQMETGIFSWVEMALISAVPFCLLAIGNVLLVWKVAQSVQTARRMGMVSSAHVSSRQRKASSLTVTLIMMSSAFLFLTLPVLVVDICFGYFDPNVANVDVDIMTKLSFANTLAVLMWYCNSAVNFYLYCLGGSKLRKELKYLLCRSGQQRNNQQALSMDSRLPRLTS